MSLLVTSSPYQASSSGTGGNTNTNTKKKVPTIRRTMKKPVPSTIPPPLYEDRRYERIGHDDDNDNMNDMYDDNSSENFDMKQSYQQNERLSKVASLLENMSNISIENGGSNLANFQPIELSDHTKYNDDGQPSSSSSSSNIPLVQPQSQTPQLQPPKRITPNAANFAPIRNNQLSDYSKSYEPPSIPIVNMNMNMNTNRNHGSTGSSISVGSGGVGMLNEERLWDRLGYIIHLLEQQANERTDTVMEEYILYVLLGVFIIFICDSFSRSGRYIR